MPKIGMRIIKTALAVFICFLISYFRGSGYPFYSAIAAVLCMQKEVGTAFEVAKDRLLGSIIGGVFGYLALLLLEIPDFSHELMEYTVLAILIIPLIYITLLLKQTNAIYITCVVFLSVSVSHGNDVSPEVFAFNRVLDTFVGIVVSLLINSSIKAFKEVEEKIEEKC